MKAVVRYTKQNKDIQGVVISNDYVYVTLTWAPNPRNVNPTGTLADADKTKQYWFAGNSNEGGSGYNEIHVNTEVPAATGHNIMNFNKFILETFNGHDVTISEIPAVYTDFADTKLTKTFRFVDPKGAKLTGVSKTVYTLNGCGKSLNEVTNNEFDVKFLRPITVKADKMDNFKDGVDVGAEGSVIDVKLAFTDWRNYAFVTTPINYYTYYGVKSITIDTDKAQTTVNGKYEPIPAGMKVEYSGVEDISAGKFGKLTYINNKAEVGEFDIKLPVAVEYAWGTVEFDIVCHVAKTVK